MSDVKAIFKYAPTESVKCPVCLEEEKKGDWYAHGGGEAHPIHAECLKSWFQEGKYSCPTCRAELNPEPLAQRVKKTSEETLNRLDNVLVSLLIANLFCNFWSLRPLSRFEYSPFHSQLFMPRIRYEISVSC